MARRNARARYSASGQHQRPTRHEDRDAQRPRGDLPLGQRLERFKESAVYAIFDDRDAVCLERTHAGSGENILETLDTFALKRQMQIARHAFTNESGEPRANGFELFQGSIRCGTADPGACTPRPDGSFFWTDQPSHIWQAKLPDDLEEGPHTVQVVTKDLHGRLFTETLAFEVREQRPPKYFKTEVFEEEAYAHRERPVSSPREPWLTPPRGALRCAFRGSRAPRRLFAPRFG